MSCLGEPGPVRIERGDRVVITGASGFIGSAVAKAVRIGEELRANYNLATDKEAQKVLFGQRARR